MLDLSPGPGQGHGLATCFNQIALRKQKVKNSLVSLTLGHLKDTGTTCVIYSLRLQKKRWKQSLIWGVENKGGKRTGRSSAG